MFGLFLYQRISAKANSCTQVLHSKHYSLARQTLELATNASFPLFSLPDCQSDIPCALRKEKTQVSSSAVHGMTKTERRPARGRHLTVTATHR